MYDVLLIDDDGKLAEVMTEYCSRFSIRIEPALLPSVALKKLQDTSFDAVILDVMLPEMDGFELCKLIRRESDVPILMLTARGDVTDRIVGLEIGADDYLPKPFDPRELVARLQVNIKRHRSHNIAVSEKPASEKPASEQFSEGLAIYSMQREVRVNDKILELTTMEYELLRLLSETPGKALTRDEILTALKGTENELFSRSVDILVSRLRAKLKPVQAIRTIHGAGYAFVLPREAPES